MTPGLAAMWLSFVAMGLFIVAAFLIFLARTKLKGLLRYLLSIIAYVALVIGAFLMFLVVVNGPK
ncbi:DUF2768 domain-containing protein [Camelliibacillus cellulosilyticus]|uniref:DUF2768 domain-containing protein n=1 Tax=Camelliibacillus cellulosilyticus TaxID=2174486 RepID=A0ABV9GKZ2_9BACL